MSHHHVRQVCSCGQVILQCRCPEPKRDEVVTNGCPKCRSGLGGKLAKEGVPVTAMPPPTPIDVSPATIEELLADVLIKQRRTNDLLERCERALDRIADRLHHAHLGGARGSY